MDELPADDPRAVRSRRDLRLMNRIMGHGGTLRRALTPHVPGDPLVAELGAGDGTLLLQVLPPANRGRLVFVDRQPVVSEETSARYARLGFSTAIEAADVFDWLRAGGSRVDCVVANLFLHHFEAPRLRELFALAAKRTDLFVACEPRRARVPLAGSRLLGLIGCNDVTRHDAHASVRAGFHGDELTRLWPQGAEWSCEERKAGLFSHLFMARRCDTTRS
ncbi:MAG TPA: methyltransferase domain-containing protein [Burkholderiales bacterium]|nr:methyltransferase domain-containing protein [Burkholderiales bacterium]